MDVRPDGMISSPPPSSTARSGQGNRVIVALGNQGSSGIFKLTFQGETIPLIDSGSLNRWAAVGIVERHKVSVSQDGVTVDGHPLLYSDPQAARELESILNRSRAVTPPKTSGAGGATGHSPPEPISESVPSSFADNVRVTRDGFEFHVLFRTRFGENKTEKLETALETFQKMRVFRPHVNMQKSGIRLVVTRWDGEIFLEEHGIQNLEHASPEEVEELIKANLQGGPAAPVSPGTKSLPHRAVVRVEVVKRSHDARFHLVLHRQDGSIQGGPLLIRPNMAKLASEKFFRPDVSISMTALNDRIIIEQNDAGTPGQRTDTFALGTLEDAARVEAVLNTCLRPPADTHAVAAAIPQPDDHAPVEPTVDRIEDQPLPPEPQLEQEPSLDAIPADAEPSPSALPDAPPATAEVKNAEKGEPTMAFLVKEWSEALFKTVETINPEDLNGEVFTALRDRFDRPISSNDYGFPAFAFEYPLKDGASASLELVLTPHYLLCNFTFGYARFGPETRLFLTRLDDYIAFGHPALRGVAEQQPGGAVFFLVSDDFARFLQTSQDRSYRSQFAPVLRATGDLAPTDRLIWPLSREERLFQMAAATAKSYGLPVAADRIVLDPNAPVFIGFVKTSPQGMEFRDGDDFVRFTPVDLELMEDGESRRFIGSNILLGWALDQEGRVCALYRRDSGFVPPQHTKLLRFISEDEREREAASLNLLASAT